MGQGSIQPTNRWQVITRFDMGMAPSECLGGFLTDHWKGSWAVRNGPGLWRTGAEPSHKATSESELGQRAGGLSLGTQKVVSPREALGRQQCAQITAERG